MEEVDLMLPTPAAPEPAPTEAPPAAPARDDEASQSASDAPESAGPSGQEANDATQEPIRDGPGPGKRIAQVVGEREDFRRLAESERDRANQAVELLSLVLRGALSPQDRAAAAGALGGQEAPPKQEDYGNNWAAYDQAMRAYEARRVTRETLQQERANWERQQQEQQRQVQARQRVEAEARLKTIVGGQMRDAVQRYPDYAEVVGSSGVDIPVRVQAAMAMTGSGGDIAYHLARHPHLVPQLTQMPDLQLGQAMQKIAFAMLNASTASVSHAPAPARPASGRGTADLGYPKDATPDQHKAWMERTFKKPAAARR